MMTTHATTPEALREISAATERPHLETPREDERVESAGTCDDGIMTVNLADCDRESVLVALEKAKAARREERGKTASVSSPLGDVSPQGYERIRRMAGKAYQNAALDAGDVNILPEPLLRNA